MTSGQHESRTTSHETDDLERSARDTGVLSSDRLLSTRREAEAILAMAAEAKRRKALDFEASRATALRAAQVSMWKEKRWRNPYYWAAFVLQGEWQ